MNRPVKIPIRLDPAMPPDVVELRGGSSVAWIDLFFALSDYVVTLQAGINDPARVLGMIDALFRPAEEPEPLGFSPERLVQGEADVAAGRVVELGEALQRIRDNPPSAGDRPGNPMPASAPVAPPPAEEPADFKTFKASFDREWEANVKLREEVAALRSELAAVDDRLAGRPALANVEGRLAKIDRACAEAGRATDALMASQREAERLRAWVANDATAISYQSMGQYRAALLSMLPPPAGGTAG